jgi:hypothetical protein
VATVGVPEAAVNPQQDHCSHRRAGSGKQAPHCIGGEQLGAFLGAVDAHHLAGRPLESWPVAHRAVDQAVVPGELERHPSPLDDVAERDRPPLLPQLPPQPGKIVGAQVGHEPALPDVGDDEVAVGLVVLPGAVGQLAGFDQGALRVEELVAQFLDRDAFGRLPGLAAGVQGVLLFQVLRQRGVGVGPRAEVVQLAPNLLGPAPGGVREEWEIGVGLARLGGLVRDGGGDKITLGQGDRSSTRVSLCSRPAVTAAGHLFRE